jgi:hypothetical protein
MYRCEGMLGMYIHRQYQLQMGEQVPKRIYTLEEMRLNKVEPTALLSPTDDTLNGVRTVLQASGAQRRHCSYACRLAPHARSPCRNTDIFCRPAGRRSSRRRSAVLWGGTQQRAAGRSARGSGVYLLCRPGVSRNMAASTCHSAPCTCMACALVVYNHEVGNRAPQNRDVLCRLPTAAGSRIWL